MKMDKTKILVIGGVWPEPTSSAAGTRIIQLIDLFIAGNYAVTFAAAAAKGEFSFDLQDKCVAEAQILLNDDSFNIFLEQLNPSIVLFDRYMTEEQYGWRVHQFCPDALKILDTEDLHCLRYARQEAMKKGIRWKVADLFNDMAKREIAAILRCDVSLIISETEMEILQQHFRIDRTLLHYLPFLEQEITGSHIQHWNPFGQREGFVFIGNYLHEPNWHTLQVLKTKIWPILQARLPKVSLHIYGAYSSQKVLQLNNKKERFLVHGRAPDARVSIATHRIMLAPIQFGAGLKGKFIDAMQTGTPSVTTAIGAEAMQGSLEWSGRIEDDTDEFINQAVALYTDESRWLKAQSNGVAIINERYSAQKFIPEFMDLLHTLPLELLNHRRQHFFGQILQHHTANGNKYMSLWIAEKNKSKS